MRGGSGVGRRAIILSRFLSSFSVFSVFRGSSLAPQPTIPILQVYNRLIFVNHEIHEAHENILGRLSPQSPNDAFDFHTWIMTEVDKQAKFYVRSTKIVV